jgi:hypothetical protein
MFHSMLASMEEEIVRQKSREELEALPTWGDPEIAAFIGETTRSVRNHRARGILPQHEYDVAGRGRSRPEVIKAAYSAKGRAA